MHTNSPSGSVGDDEEPSNCSSETEAWRNFVICLLKSKSGGKTLGANLPPSLSPMSSDVSDSYKTATSDLSLDSISNDVDELVSYDSDYPDSTSDDLKRESDHITSSEPEDKVDAYPKFICQTRAPRYFEDWDADSRFEKVSEIEEDSDHSLNNRLKLSWKNAKGLVLDSFDFCPKEFIDEITLGTPPLTNENKPLDPKRNITWSDLTNNSNNNARRTNRKDKVIPVIKEKPITGPPYPDQVDSLGCCKHCYCTCIGEPCHKILEAIEFRGLKTKDHNQFARDKEDAFWSKKIQRTENRLRNLIKWRSKFRHDLDDTADAIELGVKHPSCNKDAVMRQLFAPSSRHYRPHHF